VNALDAKAAVIGIDAEIRNFSWLDFEVLEFVGRQLTLIGSIDSSVKHDLEVIFKDINFVSMPFEWKTDTSTKVLELVEGEEAIAINQRFQVEQGYHIFRFHPEDFITPDGCLIAAKSIDWRNSNAE